LLPTKPPTGHPVPDVLALSARQATHTLQQDGKTQQEILPEMAVGSATPDSSLALRLYVGPKDIDLLKTIRPPLNGLVQFGWTGFIAEPLFYILRWIYHLIPNYGWAIVVMTIAINMLLYPLKLKSWRSMQRMQKVQPEVRSIQDRYKKYSMRDPRKQEMNKEVMAVYSREGINPMGSCLPQLAQMPIWFGLYRMLNVTIELRHAPWFGWIHDLAGRDPYYALTISMALLMYAAQKMTPMTVTDPAQQRMMSLMPIMFAGMFFIIPVSSGLILYIVTQNAMAVIQQWHLNRSSPLKPPAKSKKQMDRAAQTK
jgi:YidC/Oxa1 family membrane protein insertase